MRFVGVRQWVLIVEHLTGHIDGRKFLGFLFDISDMACVLWLPRRVLVTERAPFPSTEGRRRRVPS